jgi:hypothetical protein
MTIVSILFSSFRARINAARQQTAWLRFAKAAASAGVFILGAGSAMAQAQRMPTGDAPGADSSAPPAPHYVPNEVLIELNGNPSRKTVNALAARHRLTRLESMPIGLTSSIWMRWHITGHRSVTAVVRALEAESSVRSAQPNYIFTLQGAP